MGKCLAGLTRLINENKRRRVNLRREAALALEEKERIYHQLLERGRTSIAEGQERIMQLVWLNYFLCAGQKENLFHQYLSPLPTNTNTCESSPQTLNIVYREFF